MTDLETWFHDEGMDKFFKLLTYKRVWTPYEMDKKFSDESEFEDGGYYKIVKILGLIELPNNDIWIRFQEYIECNFPSDDTMLYKACGQPFYEVLSQIKLKEFDPDFISEDDEEIEE